MEETLPAERHSSRNALLIDSSSKRNQITPVKTCLAIRADSSSEGPIDDLTNTPPPQTKFLNSQLPGYVIERELGRGGMGSVYLARQLSLDRQVAIKVMSKRWAVDPVFVARFTREA